MEQNYNSAAQNQLAQAGTFRATPLSWTLEESDKPDSKSIAVAIQFGIKQEFAFDQSQEHGGTWSDEWPIGYFVYSRTYIVRKDGDMNAPAVKTLSDCNLWDGDFDKFVESPPEVDCLIEVEESVYNNKTSHRVKWINPDSEYPVPRTGGFKPVEDKALASIRARFQSKTRAIIGGNPSGKPGAPPAPAPKPAVKPIAGPKVAAAQPAKAPAPKAGPRPATSSGGPKPAVPAAPMNRPKPPARPVAQPAAESEEEIEQETEGDPTTGSGGEEDSTPF